MSQAEAAVDRFRSGLSCSQAVLSTYGEALGIDQETAKRLAAGFGGGIGRLGATCGAVTGAVMVLGLKFGSADGGDRQAKEKTYEQVREFSRRFQERHAHLDCRDLLGCDISTAEGHREAADRKLIATLCPEFVRSAACILEELLA